MSMREERLARREELSLMNGVSRDALVKQEVADIKRVCINLFKKSFSRYPGSYNSSWTHTVFLRRTTGTSTSERTCTRNSRATWRSSVCVRRSACATDTCSRRRCWRQKRAESRRRRTRCARLCACSRSCSCATVRQLLTKDFIFRCIFSIVLFVEIEKAMKLRDVTRVEKLMEEIVTRNCAMALSDQMERAKKLLATERTQRRYENLLRTSHLSICDVTDA